MSLTPKEIFDVLPTRFNADAAGEWTARILFNLSGDNGGVWTLQVADGQCSVNEGSTDEPTATVDMSGDTWSGIYGGTVNPMGAFMKGQIKIKGKMADVTRLNDSRIFPKG